MGKQVYTDHEFQGGARITGLPSSAGNGQPVVHEQLAAALEGVSWKDSVRVSTQGNINLAAPGSSIDGVTMSGGDRFLARAQTTQTQNGIYIWNGAASAATRAADASTFDELEGAVVAIEEGTDAGVSYRQTQANGVIGTNNVLFTVFGAQPPASETTAGIAEVATQSETDTGTDDARIVTPLKLKTSPHAKKKAIATFGDGSATQFDITHNFNTKEVIVSVRLASNDNEVECAVTRPDANTVRLNFAVAPTSNGMKAVVIG